MDHVNGGIRIAVTGNFDGFRRAQVRLFAASWLDDRPLPVNLATHSYLP